MKYFFFFPFSNIKVPRKKSIFGLPKGIFDDNKYTHGRFREITVHYKLDIKCPVYYRDFRT